MTLTPPVDSDTVPAATDFYDRYDVATLAGIKPGTVTTHIYRAKLNAAEHGQPLPGDIPLPDGYIGRAPWWHKERIDVWLEAERRSVGERGPARNKD